jgi:hypothetical protein
MMRLKASKRALAAGFNGICAAGALEDGRAPAPSAVVQTPVKSGAPAAHASKGNIVSIAAARAVRAWNAGRSVLMLPPVEWAPAMYHL